MRDSSFAAMNAFAVLIILVPVFYNLFAHDIVIYAKKNKVDAMRVSPEEYKAFSSQESWTYRLKASVCDVFSI